MPAHAPLGLKRLHPRLLHLHGTDVCVSSFERGGLLIGFRFGVFGCVLS